MPKRVLASKHAEKVLVVRRTDIFADGIWHGLKTDGLAKILNTISTKHKFLPRADVEEDARWQQIIPYLIFEYQNKIFLMKRKGDHTDRRLADKYSIGVGGHINKEDVKELKSSASRAKRGEQRVKGEGVIMDWARREFEEEVGYRGKYKLEFLGLVNDDSNDVGLVHLGLIIKLIGDSDQISVRDEHKSGSLVSLEGIGKHSKHMETWSRIVYDYLSVKKSQRIKEKKSKSVEEVKIRSVNLASDNISGILPDWLIEKYIEKGFIKIAPLSKDWKKNVDQVSVDFHLGGNIKLFKAGTYRFVDTRRGLPADAMEEVNLSEGDPFILEPGAFAIASTLEVLRLPADILGRLEGKSSLARLGILVHSTAARFDPGWNGAPVLELGNLGPKPAILYCGMPICAFTFEKLASPVRMKYEGSRSDRYSGSKIPVASKIEKYVKKR